MDGPRGSLRADAAIQKATKVGVVMNKADQVDTLNVVEVLIDLVRMEIDSDTLPSKEADGLLNDVMAIPARYAALLDQDAATRRTWKKGKQA
jgi:hypothetical protein